MTASVQHKPCYCGKRDLCRDGVDLACVTVYDNRDPRARATNYHSSEWCSRNFDEGAADVSCGCGMHKLFGPGYAVSVVWRSTERRVTGWDITTVVSEWHQTTGCTESRNRSFA
jgi:hypothetical protein